MSHLKTVMISISVGSALALTAMHLDKKIRLRNYENARQASMDAFMAELTFASDFVQKKLDAGEYRGKGVMPIFNDFEFARMIYNKD